MVELNLENTPPGSTRFLLLARQLKATAHVQHAVPKDGMKVDGRVFVRLSVLKKAKCGWGVFTGPRFVWELLEFSDEEWCEEDFRPSDLRKLRAWLKELLGLDAPCVLHPDLKKALQV